MKKVRKFLATATLATVILCSTSMARAGLLISDLSGGETQQPCTEQSATGILVVGFTGILVVGFTGILVVGAADSGEGTQNCGILVVGKP